MSAPVYVRGKLVKPLLERFNAKVVRGPDCWLWAGCKHKFGYGKLLGPSKRVDFAHRISWMLFRGPINDGLYVLHKCDNPPCVNPDHLFLGTHDDNSKDMVAKGRSGRGRSRRLSTDDVWSIRSLFASGAETRQSLSERFGMSRGYVSDIIAMRRRCLAIEEASR